MERRAVEKPLDPQRRKGDKYNLLVQPFLKWAGGKRQLMPVIKKYIPQKYTQYYEPFVGAGAVLFSLQPAKTVINDTNKELMNCYNVIRDNPEGLLELCKEHEKKNSKDYYYTLRSQDRHSTFKTLSSVKRAARLIYLNKTCFNGLFRVNSKGQFNVPYGNPINPLIADPVVIKAVSNFLNQRSVRICEGDFADSVSTAKKGAFVYFDPPYHPISDTSSFTGYSINGFGEREQERLKLVCDKLSDRGCHVLVSNSNAPFIHELYSDSRYEIVEIRASRAINAVGSKRGKIQELLIHNKYECKTIEK
ncbi:MULTISPECIES: DNA adenine methylase [unclassified Roseofilum]|uniref:DNA adenine methylase n=1 Tax=unclassified Roseofilum TaxID=2620099 RepID=UPI000E90AD37|nr:MULTISPECIES: DNA adenine methylase [unclassified Roseofilum]MBP0007838.1 DNA adenine methylase [Roseofilum sp. Belize Diploria]MBP0032568.1 DNA adenine methylase [Roseofilum sp. Belize BBD 4]HBQ99487.1 DNA methyltransferase [Cyanobacteria bacterium UBA11691]